MYTIEKKLRDAHVTHFLGKGYPKACKNVHGHGYHFSVKITGNELDKYDMLIDFGAIKEHCDNWIQENWDHKTIFATHQLDCAEFWRKNNWAYFVFPIQNSNVTAERMSEFLAKKFFEELSLVYPSICSLTVSVWETDDSVASYEVSK